MTQGDIVKIIGRILCTCVEFNSPYVPGSAVKYSYNLGYGKKYCNNNASNSNGSCKHDLNEKRES